MKHDILKNEIVLVADDTLDLVVVGAGKSHGRRRHSHHSRSRNSSRNSLSSFLSFNKISLVFVIPINIAAVFNINNGGSNVGQTGTATAGQTNGIGVST